MTPGKVDHERELANDGRALARRSPHPRTCLPTHSRQPATARTPPALVDDPVLRPGLPTLRVRSDRPPIPSTGPARETDPGDDLFHEPETHPKTATAGAPPEVTVRDPPPITGRPSSHTSQITHTSRCALSTVRSSRSRPTSPSRAKRSLGRVWAHPSGSAAISADSTQH